MKDERIEKIEKILEQYFDCSYQVRVELSVNEIITVEISNTKKIASLRIYPDALKTVGVWLLDVKLINTINEIIDKIHQESFISRELEVINYR